MLNDGKKKQPMVSVIIPVFNVEKYLDRCIKSVVKQTYYEIEIILVDDGSTDSSGNKCDVWAEKDQRINVIHKENGGLGMARNSGLDVAQGAYVCFIDSDDWVESTMVASAVDAAKKYNVDMVCYGLTKDNPEGNTIFTLHPTSNIVTFRGREVQERFLPDYIAPRPDSIKPLMSACSCLISRTRIEENHWRFVSERDIISEDVYSLLNLCASITSVCVLRDAFYHYCFNESSLTHVYREDRFRKIKVFYEKCQQLCERNGYGNEVKERLKKPFLDFTVAAMKQVYETNLSNVEKNETIRSICLDDTLQEVIRTIQPENMTWKTKILWSLVRRKKLSLVVICLHISSCRSN